MLLILYGNESAKPDRRFGELLAGERSDTYIRPQVSPSLPNRIISRTWLEERHFFWARSPFFVVEATVTYVSD